MAQRQFRSDDTSPWNERYGDGSGGVGSIDTSTFSPVRESCSGTATNTALTIGSASTFANGDLIFIHQSRGTNSGVWELNKIASGGGTTSLTLAYPLCNTYTDSGDSQAQLHKLIQYSALTINTGQLLTSSDWDQNVDGMAFYLCNGLTTVTGNITGKGRGFRGGAPENTPTFFGEGDAGAADTRSTANNGSGGGGVNSNSGDAAAGGGNGTAGANGPGDQGGTGGTVSGNADLTIMNFGGGGGGSNGTSSGPGGNGGAVILIISKRITVTGGIDNGGNNGGGALAEAGAGGGAGGSILLKGQIITLGSGLVTANGGSGSSGSNATGGNGGAGRIHADYGISISGTTSPTLDSRQDSVLNDGGFLSLLI